MAGTSLFLSLPRELRDEIYKFALPPTIFCLTFHVVHGSRGFTSVALPLPDQRDFIYSFHLREGETGFKDVLPLLLSCRLVYNDVVEMVYSINTFRFHQADFLPLAFFSLPRQGLASITSLELFLGIRPCGEIDCLGENTSRQREAIERILLSVETLLPRLRKLYLETHLRTQELRPMPEDVVPLVDFRRMGERHQWEVGKLVEMLDKFAANMAPRLEEFQFAPQASLYSAIARRFRNAPRQDGLEILLLSIRRFRREVPSSRPGLRKTPSYWISDGDTSFGRPHYYLPVLDE